MTDARHLTPRETPLETPHEPAIGSGAPAPAPAAAPAPAPAPGPASAPGPAHAKSPRGHAPHATGSALLPQDERDKLSLRLQQALST
ncbi:hypothetical protein ACQKIP_40205, partial [Streptomyces sp. NPDC059900]